jgi:deoxyadenosine/deoxycytidine kinase
MIISVEGNIGSGKSTLLAELASRTSASGRPLVVEPEPVEEWTAPFRMSAPAGGEAITTNMLNEFYKRPTENCLAFQLVVLHTRLEQWRRILGRLCDDPELVTVTERTMESDRAIFAATNLMHSPCWLKAYERWYAETQESLLPLHRLYRNKHQAPIEHLVVYVRCSAEKCLERIERRSRPEEGGLTLDYLRSIEAAHDKWIANVATMRQDTRVIVVEAAQDGEDAVRRIADTVVKSIYDQKATCAPIIRSEPDLVGSPQISGLNPDPTHSLTLNGREIDV